MDSRAREPYRSVRARGAGHAPRRVIAADGNPLSRHLVRLKRAIGSPGSFFACWCLNGKEGKFQIGTTTIRKEVAPTYIATFFERFGSNGMMIDQYTTDMYNHLDVGVRSGAFVLLRIIVGIKRGEMPPNLGHAYLRAFKGECLSDAHRQQITFDEITPDPAQCPDITSAPYIFPEADLVPTVGHSELGHGATNCTMATVVGLHGGSVKEVHLLDVVDLPSFISINGHVVPLRFQDANAVDRTNNPIASRPQSTLPGLFRSQSVAAAATAATPTPADGASRTRPAPVSPASSDSVQYLGRKKARRSRIVNSDE